MVFTSDRVPFKLFIGRMISQSHCLEKDLNDTLDRKLDFLVTTLFHPNYQLDRHSTSIRNEPIAKADQLLQEEDWSTGMIHKCSRSYDFENENDGIRKESKFLFKQEINYAIHVGTYAVIIPCPTAQPLNYARIINKFLSQGNCQLWVTIPLHDGEGDSDPHRVWNNFIHFKSLINDTSKLGVCFEIGEDLPETEVLQRWKAENMKAVVLRTKIFMTNQKGFPILSGKHDSFIKSLFPHRVNFILRGKGNAEDLTEYSNYIRYTFSQQERYSKNEWTAYNYYDVPQIPLQPLKENLQSQIYGYFEKDSTKYEVYQEAIYQALKDNFDENDRVVLMVLGAGRAPIVHSAFRAADQAKRNIHVYAVEKNPNAIVTIRSFLANNPAYAQNITVIHADIRDWIPPQLADIIVSELLGSFGDNELSPECLEPAQRLLKPNGINIPHEYTSFIEPISYPILHNRLENNSIKMASMECSMVIRLLNYYQASQIQPCFTFNHPDTDQHGFKRFKSIEFKFAQDAIIHGFAGYFEAKLYKEIKLSINPEQHTPNMFSWFPIFFPLETAFTVSSSRSLRINIWRQKTKKKVWYEWQAESFDTTTGKAIVITRIFNVNGQNPA